MANSLELEFVMASSDSDQRGESGDTGERPRRPTLTTKHGKAWYKQMFNDDWLKVDKFKPWLRPEPGNRFAARCGICSKTLIGVNKSGLHKHAETTKHIKNCKTKKCTPFSLIESTLMTSPEEFIDSTDWTRDRLQLLVSLYANEELLWNMSLPNYHHKRPRKEAYNRIAVAMDLPLEAILRKVRYIRTYYTRELLKMRRNPTGTPHKPTWPLYNIVDSFLRDHIQYHKATKLQQGADSSGSDLDEDIDDTEDLQTEDIELLMGQPVIVRTNFSEPNYSEHTLLDESSSKRLSSDSKMKPTKRQKLQSGSSEILRNVGSGQSAEDLDSIFGRYVSNELRLIKDLKCKQFAKLQIHNILFNAQFGLSAAPQEVNLPT